MNNKRFYRTFILFKNIHISQIQFNTHTNRADKFEMSIIIKVHTVSIKIVRLLPRALMSPVFDTTLFHFVQFFIKSPKQSLGDLLFLLRFLLLFLLLLFLSRSMNLFTADLRNYMTEFHETWWSYRYIFLVDPKVFRFVVKGDKFIFLGVQRGWGLL